MIEKHFDSKEVAVVEMFLTNIPKPSILKMLITQRKIIELWGSPVPRTNQY
jgi:hypothetical protein